MRDPTWPDLADALERARRHGRPQLVASCTPLREAPDLVALLGAAEQAGERRFFAARPSDGSSLLALGCAAALESWSLQPFVEIRRAHEQLLAQAELPTDASPPCVGGFAFEPRSPAERAEAWRPFANASFALPELAIECRDGQSSLWLCAVLPAQDDGGAFAERVRSRWQRLLRIPASAAAAPRLDGFTVPEPSPVYREACAKVIGAIRRGEARKTVLAWSERLELPAPCSAIATIRELLRTHPRSLTFAQGLAATTFLGSTPERLIALSNGQAEAWAVAGTAPRGASDQQRAELARELRESPKERAEHAFVVTAIQNVLAEVGSEVEVSSEPRVFDTGAVQHLFTPLRARIANGCDVIDLLERLHPTPALGGTPRAAALELIREHEQFDRGGYAGPLGWLDGRGGGEFWVALRCGLLAGRSLHLFAGSGLVAASDPDREAAETSLKMRSLWEAMVPA